ncbi:hypothetical protein [Roseovarius sp. MMSF_3281]|uniref:hypothetical protein n=1 Tax=Roseovarius sp. MMSF_3281 TaxID=3046694 RepID=UPI00273DFC09|nr:hypothetical protein [Roseovarius sp. MMSF_3281]
MANDLVKRLRSLTNFPDTATRQAADRIEALEDENARLKEYSFVVSKALTSLTVGGSEFFTTDKRFGFYEADIPACVKNIEWRMEQQRKFGEARAHAALRDTGKEGE